MSPIHEKVKTTNMIEIRGQKDQDFPLLRFSSLESTTNCFAPVVLDPNTIIL